MRIERVDVGIVEVPLRTPFVTALRTVENLRDVIVRVRGDDGQVAFGEAPPTAAITGETEESIVAALEELLIPIVVGRDIGDLNVLLDEVYLACDGNSSAKAAMDIALHDLWGKWLEQPLVRLLGGEPGELETDLTISVGPPDQMVEHSLEALRRGFRILKIKVGSDAEADLDRLMAVHAAVAGRASIRLDANQGWSPDEAVSLLEGWASQGIDIELVEQPTPKDDLDGLAFVNQRSPYPIMADESSFNLSDVLELCRRRAVSLINIKLMKCGGIAQARRMVAVAEHFGVECMMGCMLEAKVSVAGACHLARAYRGITKIDLDGPALCLTDPVIGGPVFDGPSIVVPDTPGLGVTEVEGVRYRNR